MSPSQSNQIPCPLCQKASGYYSHKTAFGQTWNLRHCPACDYGFIVPRPSAEELTAIYLEGSERFYPDFTGLRPQLRADCRTFIDRLGQLTPKRGRALDIGGGDGNNSYHLRRVGFSSLMIDLDPRIAEAAKVVGANFQKCAFEELPDAGPYDAIVMSQVLEHARDPQVWLKQAAELLSPGGVLAIAVPNFGGVYRLLGRRDPFIIPPYHLNYFSARALTRALEQAGLEVIWRESWNEIWMGDPRKRFYMLRRMFGWTWELLSRRLDRTTLGVVLRIYAQRKVEMAKVETAG